MQLPAVRAGGNMAGQGQFGMSLSELRELMKEHKAEALEIIINKYGGVLEICKKLKTSPTEGEYHIFRTTKLCYLRQQG